MKRAWWILSLLVAAGACAQGAPPATEDDDGAGAAAGTAGADAGGDDGAGGAGTAGAAICGDGVAEGEELCDGSDFRDQSCQSFGFKGGELICHADICKPDTAECLNQICGNGEREDPEECDGSDLGSETCVDLGFAGGMLSCDPMCMLTGCKDAYQADFEDGMLPTGMTLGGAASWFVSTTQPHLGSYALQSGAIGNDQATSAYLDLDFDVAGSLAFWHRVDSEPGFDKLYFFIDGVEQNQWSGASGWLWSSFSLEAGSHAFEWRYEKDGSVGTNSDAAWIDDITVTSGYLP